MNNTRLTITNRVRWTVSLICIVLILLAGAAATVAGDHLKAARFPGNDHRRLQNTKFLYAVHQVHHVLVVLDVERMALKGV